MGELIGRYNCEAKSNLRFVLPEVAADNGIYYQEAVKSLVNAKRLARRGFNPVSGIISVAQQTGDGYARVYSYQKDGSQSSAIILTAPDFEDALRQTFGFEVDNVLRQLAEITQPTDFVSISGELVGRLNLQYEGCVSWGEDRDLEQKGTWLIRRRK